VADAAHRLRERGVTRTREDPEEAWRCCDAWMRTLVHKWNGREYAARYGAALPELLWHGGLGDAVPVDSLPDSFVVRPVRGTRREGVLVVAGGRELLRGEDASPAELRRRLAPWRRLRQPVPLLVEEFVTREDGGVRLPLELKCHTFGDTVAAVQLLERRGLEIEACRFYDADWRPWDDVGHTTLRLAEPRDAPEGFDEVVAICSRIGADLGTYVRIDFFASAGRCVFNEFSTVPMGGHGFTAYCNRVFGDLWEERFPDAI
jgi:hypothetical protein